MIDTTLRWWCNQRFLLAIAGERSYPDIESRGFRHRWSSHRRADAADSVEAHSATERFNSVVPLVQRHLHQRSITAPYRLNAAQDRMAFVALLSA